MSLKHHLFDCVLFSPDLTFIESLVNFGAIYSEYWAWTLHEIFMFRSLLKLRGTMPHYAVARGRSVGIFDTWPECEAQVKGFTGAIFKKFKTQGEANEFIEQKRSTTTLSLIAQASTVLKSKSKPNTFNKRSASENGSAAERMAKKSKIDEDKTNDFTSNIVQMKKYGDHNFLEDNEGYVHVYTDGSCENNGRSNAIAGYGVYFSEGHLLNTSEAVEGPATNNRGEIQAVTKAIQLAATVGITKLCINSDSQFVIKSVTEWMKNWKKRNWRLAGGGSVKNEIDFRALDRVIEDNPQISIRWNYVPAHIGIRGNERADELARQGAQKYRK